MVFLHQRSPVRSWSSLIPIIIPRTMRVWSPRSRMTMSHRFIAGITSRSKRYSRSADCIKRLVSGRIRSSNFLRASLVFKKSQIIGAVFQELTVTLCHSFSSIFLRVLTWVVFPDPSTHSNTMNVPGRAWQLLIFGRIEQI